MIHVRNLNWSLLLLLAISCKEKAPLSTVPFGAASVPGNAKPVAAIVYKVNCWEEGGQFFIAGICTNPTTEWQKIWLEATPLNAAGKPVAISNCGSMIVPTFSDAIPPSGRTSFYASWPLADFSEKPDTCKIKGMMATQPPAGPILVSSITNGLKMLVPSIPGQPPAEERGWHVSSTVSNPLQIVASHPRFEVLVYGADGLLWLSTVLNPEDPAAAQIFHFEREGPLQPGEERAFNLQVYYQALPQVLRDKKIGRVEVLPFEARL